MKRIIQNIPQEGKAHFQNITEDKALAIVSEKEVACDRRNIVNIIQCKTQVFTLSVNISVITEGTPIIQQYFWQNKITQQKLKLQMIRKGFN